MAELESIRTMESGLEGLTCEDLTPMHVPGLAPRWEDCTLHNAAPDVI